MCEGTFTPYPLQLQYLATVNKPSEHILYIHGIYCTIQGINFGYAKCPDWMAILMYLKYMDTVEPWFDEALFNEVLEWC